MTCEEPAIETGRFVKIFAGDAKCLAVLVVVGGPPVRGSRVGVSHIFTINFPATFQPQFTWMGELRNTPTLVPEPTWVGELRNAPTLAGVGEIT